MVKVILDSPVCDPEIPCPAQPCPRAGERWRLFSAEDAAERSEHLLTLRLTETAPFLYENDGRFLAQVFYREQE